MGWSQRTRRKLRLAKRLVVIENRGRQPSGQPRLASDSGAPLLFSHGLVRVPNQKSDLPVQEIISPMPCVHLSMTCETIEDTEASIRDSTLCGLIDRPAVRAGEDYGGGLRPSCHARSVRLESAQSGRFWNSVCAKQPCGNFHAMPFKRS